MKDHEIRETVSRVQELCFQFRDAQQLRERIANFLVPVLKAAPVAPAAVAPKLAVWYGAMPESNGRTNWTAILHNGDICTGITLDRSEYPDRVRYEADRARWLIGELDEEPFILDYDAEKHSGYVEPAAPAPTVAADAAVPSDMPDELPGANQDWATIDPSVAFHLIERHADNWAHAGQLMELWRSAVNARDAAAAQPDERAASPQSGEKGEEPVARLQSHISDRPYSKGTEVFEVVILDRERACDGMDLYARVAAPQAALDTEQIDAIREQFHPSEMPSRGLVQRIATLLTQAPTKRMSDAARDAEEAAGLIGPAMVEHEFSVSPSSGIEICLHCGISKVAARTNTICDEASIDAARKAEIERSGSTGGEA